MVMAYRYPGGENRAAIELYPVSGRKSAAAAQTAGLAPSSISTLVIEGDNRPGLGHTHRQSDRRCRDQHELRDGAGSGTKILGGVRLRE